MALTGARPRVSWSSSPAICGTWWPKARHVSGRRAEDGDTHRPLPEFLEALAILFKVLTPCLKTLPKTGPDADVLAEWKKERRRFVGEVRRFESRVGKAGAEWGAHPPTPAPA